ncbi:MAG: molybdopterin cofactor-binding domain-containing protein [Halobacteriales archaeon]|nr:molybdopterin cofactor-binding domain-containing protein [Halobacteriales archaeon]
MPTETVRGDEPTPNEMVGSSVQRREDPHLLTGESEYTDDVQSRDLHHLALVRSQYGHARIESVDAADAEAIDGVVAVYTAADVEASGVPGEIPASAPEWSADPKHPLLAGEEVFYQGQAVAAVVAEDRYTAAEAAEAVTVEYERLDAVTDLEGALEEGAPAVHEDVPDNVAFTWEQGDAEATEAAFEAADRVVEVGDVVNNRVIPTAMEPRSAVATYRSSDRELSVVASTQNPHTLRGGFSEALDLPEHKVQVRPPDVGGGFGAKLQPYAGYMLTGWAAMQLGEPVKWTATRGEDFASMVHSRHQRSRAEVALTADGEMTAMRVRTRGDLGAYAMWGTGIHTANFGRMFVGQYDLEAAHIEVTGVFTNTAPISAYRGAGRPEATYFAERLARHVARELDEDPAEFRRRNMVPPDAFPYDNGVGHEYDSGDFEGTLDAALEAVDYDALRERQAELREAGRYLGIGLACYVEACGAAPGWPETGVVRVTPGGKVVVESGTAEIGTGHRTGYTQIVASALGVPFDDIEIVEGDTNRVGYGGGTAGSRAMPVGGSAVHDSAVDVREKARRIAAHELEADPEDVVAGDGRFHLAGAPDRAVSLEEVASAAHSGDRPEGMEPGLEATTYYDPSNYTYPFGSYVAVVEVDPDTGEIEIERFLSVDDVGTQINPKLVEGQIHGGVAQGIGQARLERTSYDDNGNLLSGTLQDYALPKAFHLPELETRSTVTESPHNPLGAKGVGEAGAIGAPPALVNAVLDALEPLGVEALDMPLTDEAVWRAVQEAA